MGERIPVEDFLAELEDDFDAAANMVGSGRPEEYAIRRAFVDQRREYVLGRLRAALKGQKFVNLPDAVDSRNDEGRVWRREDWFDLMVEQQMKQNWTGEDEGDGAKQLPYIHETWFTDNNEPFPGSPIRGKAAFERALLAYYAGGGDRGVAYRLVGSPNTTRYYVHPYINNRGRLDVFCTIPEEQEDPSCGIKR
jgi:hypothetical protein